MDIKQGLKYGNEGEQDVENWLRFSRNCAVMPAHEAGRNDKGARIWWQKGIVCPDLLVFPQKTKTMPFLWMEVKRKSTFSWYRKGACWTTGIDLYYFNQYLLTHQITSIPVWLLFWHDKTIFDIHAKAQSPTGLYGNDIVKLNKSYSHKHDAYGTGGMIYFELKHLLKLADVQTVITSKPQAA